MSATHEDLVLRLQRLEEHFQELASTVSHPLPTPQPRGDLADQISLRAWLRISAPTFALLTLGFTLLWNAQQAGNAQHFEMSRSLGRLDGAIDRLDVRMASFDEHLMGFGKRLASFDQRLLHFDQRLESFDQRLETFDQRLVSFDQRLLSMDRNIGALGASVEKLDKSVERLSSRL